MRWRLAQILDLDSRFRRVSYVNSLVGCLLSDFCAASDDVFNRANVGAQLSFSVVLGALDQTVSGPPKEESGDEQQAGKRSNWVCQKLLPPIFLWLVVFASGWSLANWTRSIGDGLIERGRRFLGRAFWILGFLAFLATLYLLFFDRGLCSLR
jgi:hypothetical protein